MKQIYGKRSRSTLSIVIIISVGIHVLALFAFGAFKIVESITREEETFEAPPITEAPEPPPPPSRLEQRNQESSPPRPNPITVDSPDIELPALDIDLNVDQASAYGRGAGGFGSGGPGQMREMSLNLTDFGYSDFVEGSLEGTLFDTKRDRNGKEIVDFSRIDFNQVNSWLTPRMQDITREFTDGSWNISALERKYLSSEKKLYATYFYIPNGDAQKAPEAFGAGDEIQAVSILAFYEGEFTPRESGRFRFVGKADDAIVVRANNRIVFDGSLSNQYSEFDQNEHGSGPELMGRETNVGDWMKWKEGRPIDLEVMIAEAPGGRFYAYLFVQKEGENDVRIFSTKRLSPEEKDRLRSIHPDLTARL